MIYYIRLELAGLAASVAWALAPRTGISTRYEVPGFILTRRTRSYRVWPNALRLRLRSILSDNFIHDGIVYADMVVYKFCVFIHRAWTKLVSGPTLSAIAAQHKWPKAYPEV